LLYFMRNIVQIESLEELCQLNDNFKKICGLYLKSFVEIMTVEIYIISLHRHTNYICN